MGVLLFSFVGLLQFVFYLLLVYWYLLFVYFYSSIFLCVHYFIQTLFLLPFYYLLIYDDDVRFYVLRLLL